MPLLHDLVLYLASQSLGTPAVDLFSNGLPLDDPSAPIPDAIIAVQATGGAPPLYIHNDPAPSVSRPTVQVIVRGAAKDIAVTLAKAEQAWLALSSIANQDLSGTRYLTIRPLQSPFPLYEDDHQRPIVVFNVLCERAAA